MRAFKWLGIEFIEVSWAEKAVSAVGSALAIFCVFYMTSHSLPAVAAAGVITSLGATAVLLYAVPQGPLSQPWPLLGGHTLSAVIGVCVAKYVPDPAFATAIAVGLAIGVMYQFKCIHPPGGATAFAAVMGGPAVHELGFIFVLYPVLLNAIIMLVLAVVINYPFRWRRYPAAWLERSNRRDAANGDRVIQPVPVSEELHRDVSGALASLDSYVDISEDDLLYLAREIANRIEQRTGNQIIGNPAKNPRDDEFVSLTTTSQANAKWMEAIDVSDRNRQASRVTHSVE